MLCRCAILRLGGSVSRNTPLDCSSASLRQRLRAPAARFIGPWPWQQGQLPALLVQPMLTRSVCHGTLRA